GGHRAAEGDRQRALQRSAAGRGGLMLDARWIRRDPEGVRARLARRGAAEQTGAAIDRYLELDDERRALIAEGEALKARRNAVNREVSERKRRGEAADDVIAEMKA